MRPSLRIPTTLGLLVASASLLAAPASAQSFQNNTTQIPQGNPGNNSFSENIGFADIDLDGDYDAMWSDGGDCCNDRNRVWINQGGLQGGTMGVFVDETGARTPTGNDESRDVDFVDFDNDGDADAYISNTSTNSNQGNRFWVNMGGAQGGTAGFFTDETSTRWVNIADNGPTTSSSLPLSQKIVGGVFDGSFVDWSCDCVFGDLDNDGDIDLVHTTYGGNFNGNVPSRMFLNDGAGFYEEFNPSDFQLSGTDINNGDPALWAQGVFQSATTNADGAQADIADSPLGVEIGDFNGNFDIDVLQGARNEYPRVYWNRTAVNGGVFTSFRDVSENVLGQKAFGGGNYEQEMGDFDNDNDLDIYGLNWAGTFSDIVATNNGSGFFSTFTILSGSGTDDNEGDFFDYDNDGNLDLYIGNFLGQDRLYNNSGAPGYTFANVTGSQLPSLTRTALGVETADVDFDGDTDIFVGNDSGAANYFLKNLTNIPDTTAPRVVLEQMADRLPSPTETRVRATVYDNNSWDRNQYAIVEIEYTVNAGPPQTVPMIFAGGQNFTGAIDGTLAGTIAYFVRATDDHGNTGTSGTLQYVSNGGTVSYCTAGTSEAGCQALMATTGTSSATAATGFTLDASGVQGGKDGLFFYGANGRQANSWGSGTSFQCVVPPVRRGGLLTGNGTLGSCNATFSQDLNARWTAKPAHNPGAGAVVQAQLWYRDPLNTSNQTTSLSDAVEFTVQP